MAGTADIRYIGWTRGNAVFREGHEAYDPVGQTTNVCPADWGIYRVTGVTANETVNLVAPLEGTFLTLFFGSSACAPGSTLTFGANINNGAFANPYTFTVGKDTLVELVMVGGAGNYKVTNIQLY